MEVESLQFVSRHTLESSRGSTLPRKYNLQDTLLKAYPEKNWKFRKIFSKGQTYLTKLVSELFGSSIKLECGYKHPSIKHSKSDKNIELDLFVPDYHLAIEYQGLQHEFPSFRGKLKLQKERDQEKRLLCQQNGILLIEIPELWSGLIDDLKTTIHHYYCKDCTNNTLLPLPFPCPPNGSLIPPSNADIQRAKRTRNTSGSGNKYGKLFMLPKQYYANINPTDWWLSEKYDGFRVMWVATEKHFKTKGNTTIIPPAFIVNQLPLNINLDGEIWCVCMYCGVLFVMCWCGWCVF